MTERKIQVIKALQAVALQGKLTHPGLADCQVLKIAKEAVESWEATVPSSAQEFIEFLAHEYLSYNKLKLIIGDFLRQEIV